MDIAQLLQLSVDKNASDIHLVAGLPPTLRVDGSLVRVPNEQPLTKETIEAFIKTFLNAEQTERVTVNKEIDFAIPFSEAARFRANVYNQKGTLAAALRRIPLKIPTMEDLALPAVCQSFVKLRQGLVLVTGPTGSGKSTTLAAMLNEINKTKPVHILTIEDPVEFVFVPQMSTISQREMRQDTLSWEIALRSALREDPDVVLVGEMRDFETIAAALTLAETGHLVFATLHTNSAAQTIDRIVDVFPENQQSQVRMQLSNVIEGVYSQRLIPRVNGGRIAAYEIMTATGAVRTTIREGKTHQIDNIIQTSGEYGMVMIEKILADHVTKGLISQEEAASFAIRPEELGRLLNPATATTGAPQPAAK